MFVHQFGGNWTEEKLDCLCKYLQAYRNIFNSNPFARMKYYTNYVDAFAGTGYRSSVSNSEISSDIPLPIDLNIALDTQE